MNSWVNGLNKVNKYLDNYKEAFSYSRLLILRKKEKKKLNTVLSNLEKW